MHVLFTAERVKGLLALGIVCVWLCAPATSNAAAVTFHTPAFAYADHFAGASVDAGRGRIRGVDGCAVLMCYRGGPVQFAPRVYLVLWGDWSANGDPFGVQDRLTAFLRGVGSSSWAKTMGQYGLGCIIGSFTCPATASLIRNQPNQLTGTLKDSSAVPATPSMSSIAAEAVKAAVHFNDMSENAEYVIALPRGHADSSFVDKGGRACAWHSWVSPIRGTGVFFTALPYMPDAGRACGNFSINRDPLDGVTIVESHEYAETITDPYTGAGVLEGWDDNARTKGEIGDKCVTTQNTIMGTATFPVQSLWSNAQYAATGAGCVFR